MTITTPQEYDALMEYARQLESLARMLRAKVPPAHVDYITKDRAGGWCARMATDLYDMLSRINAGARA